jgi:GT2 family glycosyltransferase
VTDMGVVAIGRNEGERLRICLESVLGQASIVAYVDSGSDDGSETLARSLGAEVIAMDRSLPFTAARARNEGAAQLLKIAPFVRYIQFVDGDCEVVSGWLDRARSELEAAPDVAVVCGRRRERHPGQSSYNRLADLEWDTPVGEAKYCGGDAMIRVESFEVVGGYEPSLIAGEEPDLCIRLRARGWKIVRIDAEMTLHDIAMTRVSQWWRRSVRAGHAYAEGAARHGSSPDQHWVREARGVAVWGLILPLVALAMVWPLGLASLGLLLVYPLQFLRLAWRFRRMGIGSGTASDARLYAFACVVAKFPMALGLLQYHASRLLGHRTQLIEYRGPMFQRSDQLRPTLETSGSRPLQ